MDITHLREAHGITYDLITIEPLANGLAILRYSYRADGSNRTVLRIIPGLLYTDLKNALWSAFLMAGYDMRHFDVGDKIGHGIRAYRNNANKLYVPGRTPPPLRPVSYPEPALAVCPPQAALAVPDRRRRKK